MANEKEEIYDVLVVGAGCAGLSAGMYSGRFNLKTAVIGEMPGGMITTTHIVENYPGFVSISGQGLADALLKHMESYDVPLLMQKVEGVKKENGLFVLKTDSGTLRGRTLIAATGTEWKKLGIPGEKEFANKGVHYCALCDGAFYKNKVMAVVGSGDSAVKEAAMLAGMASKLYMLVRGEGLHAEPVTMKALKACKNVEVFAQVQVKEVLGDKKVRELVLTKKIAPAGGKESERLAVDALFVQIGHSAQTQWLDGLGVAKNAKGEIVIDRLAKTNVEGLYAAGDCTDTEFKQAITGAAEGVSAAYSAYSHLTKGKK